MRYAVNDGIYFRYVIRNYYLLVNEIKKEKRKKKGRKESSKEKKEIRK